MDLHSLSSQTQTVSMPLFSSFESLCVRLTIASSSYLLLTIYRPPSSNMTIFLSEFSTLLEDIISSLSELIITGDLNIHVDDATCYTATSFLSILHSFGLSQLVDFPTHISGHTLDLVITRSSSTFFSEVDYTDPSLSDHSAIISSCFHRRFPNFLINMQHSELFPVLANLVSLSLLKK